MPITRESKRGPKPQPEHYRASRFVGVRLTPAERARAERDAQREGCSLSELARTALEEFHLRSDC